MAKEKLTEAKDILKGVKLKLVEIASLNLAQVDEIADLKAALEACENKWYDGALRMLRNQWSLSFIKPGFTGSRRDGWQPSR